MYNKLKSESHFYRILSDIHHSGLHSSFSYRPVPDNGVYNFLNNCLAHEFLFRTSELQLFS